MSEKIVVKRHIPMRRDSITNKEIPGRIRTERHTRKCREDFLLSLGRYEDWKWRWPDYCVFCDAAGMKTWSENQAPHGSGMRWMEPFEELCEECILKGKCPRCGYQHEEDWNDDEYDACEFCGWNWDKDADDILPFCENECMCWREEWEEDGIEYPTLR